MSLEAFEMRAGAKKRPFLIAGLVGEEEDTVFFREDGAVAFPGVFLAEYPMSLRPDQRKGEAAHEA